jgi:hypothetical protein
MRMSPFLILAMLAASPANLRATEQEQHPSYTLVLRSSDLPEKDRQDILKNIDVSAYPPEVMSEVVLSKVRDLGYVQSVVQEQKQESDNHILLTETISAGIRYRLRTINVVKSTVFTSDQLRKEVPIDPSEALSSSQIGKGLEQIRNLYASKGYVDTVITPELRFDSQKQLADVTLEVDEGPPYHFGALFLKGVEPHPGAAKQLTASWAPLHGRLFNPSMLDKWLQANKTTCPSCTERDLTYTLRNVSRSSNVVDVTLELSPHPLQSRPDGCSIAADGRDDSLSSKNLLPKSRAK